MNHPNSESALTSPLFTNSSSGSANVINRTAGHGYHVLFSGEHAVAPDGTIGVCYVTNKVFQANGAIIANQVEGTAHSGCYKPSTAEAERRYQELENNFGPTSRIVPLICNKLVPTTELLISSKSTMKDTFRRRRIHIYQTCNSPLFDVRNCIYSSNTIMHYINKTPMDF